MTYYHLPNEEQLLAELVITASEEASERFEAIIARGDPADVTLEAALRDLRAQMFGDVDRHADLVSGTVATLDGYRR